MFYVVFPIRAQEILAIVKVDAELVETQEKGIFKDMENNITQFINQRKWTNDKFNGSERIKMNLTIKLDRKSDVNVGKYSATAQIQFSRPIFGTGYESMLINIFDKDFGFDFPQGQTIEYNDNAYLANISSLIAFYVYIGLGIDYDSFSKNGGSIFFEKANLISANAQNAPYDGWRQAGSNPNSRYWTIENFMSPSFQLFREATYTYYRNGMDQLAINPDEGRNKIIQSLEAVKLVWDAKPTAPLLKTYFNSKGDEYVKIFSESPAAEKGKVVELLKVMDPTATENYEKILK
ncbi:MAG: DUF4835 family protein [Cytophagales bacterium]